MTEKEKTSTNLLHSTEDLRKLIIDNPDLPLLVFAGEDANHNGDYPYMSCSCIIPYIGEFLDCSQTINESICYTNRDDFKYDLADYLDNLEDVAAMTDVEFDARLKQELAKYEPYWKKCIILHVDN